MRTVSRLFVALGASVLLAGSPLIEPASANDAKRVIGGIIGGILGGLLMQPYQPRGYHGYGGSYRSQNKKGPSTAGSGHEFSVDVALASLGTNKNLDNILREVTFKSTEATAGSDDSRKFGHKGDVDDIKTDLPSTLDEFTKKIQDLMASNTSAVGDVSIVSVELTLNEVYEAKEQDLLRQFEQLPGSKYTSEQFKVDILHEAEERLARFREGNNRGMVMIGQIKQLFMEAARDVYVRTFEIAELTGMN